MENISNRIFNKIPNNFPLINNNSSKDKLQSYLATGNFQKNIINLKNILSNNVQMKKFYHRINNNSLKINELKRFNTQQNSRRKNKNALNKLTLPEEYNILLAKKTNKFTNNSRKINTINLKKEILNNNINAKKIKNKNKNNAIISNYKQIYRNYNPEYYSVNTYNSFLSNNNIFLDNHFHTKKFSDNIINNNYNLNATLPIRKIKISNFDKSNIIITHKKLSFNSNKKEYLNESYLINHNIIRKKENKELNSSAMFVYKKNNINNKNDISWDYSLGKNPKYNFYPKNNKLNQKFIISNYLSEDKQNTNEINEETVNDNINVKDIGKIADNLDFPILNDDKKSNTVILNENKASDDSLSDIANDIVKNLIETENEDINTQETVPSSSNRELDEITNSTKDIQYNNNNQNNKKIIYEKKSTIKSTIVNNFFISSEGNQYKNNNLKKDINYNVFVVNKYNNNKINSNSNIPTLVTQTYKDPNILREEKNNIKQNIIEENDNYNNFIEKKNKDNFNNNNIIKNENSCEKIIPENNYNPNNNLIQQNNNDINNYNNDLSSNIDYQNNQKKINENNYNIEQNNNYDFNINEPNKTQNFNRNSSNKIQNINNNHIYNLHSNINNNLNLIYSLKKKPNPIRITNSTLNKILSSSNTNFDNNNIFVDNNKLNFPINDFNKKYLLNSQINNQRKKNVDNNNNLSNNISFNKDDTNNIIEYKINFKNYYLKKKCVNNISNVTQTNKINNLNNTLNSNENNNNIPNIIDQKDNIKNNDLSINTKKHITFNLNNNMFIKFSKDDLITNSEITSKDGQIYNNPQRDMNFYQNELKFIKPKPIIKTFLSKDIKINKDYILVENLDDDFGEDNIKSLEKSFEKSADKITH